MSSTPEPAYYLNFTSTCQHCGATVRTVDGETQPHECEIANVVEADAEPSGGTR